MTAPVAHPEVDLSDPNLYATGDPHAVWTYLRHNAPVYFHEHGYGPGFWAITRYEDVVRLSSDRRMSSAGGRSTLGTSTTGAEILVCTDPPRHTQLRALVNKAFTPRVVAQLEPYVRRIVDGLIDEVVAAGTCDFASDIAARVPFTVICELLGVPEEDRGPLSHEVGHFMESSGHVHAEPRSDMDLGRYFLDLANTRRESGSDDLISRLVAAEIDGERLSDGDVLALAMLLFIAGAETTMNSIAGGVLAFIEHPDQRERLDDDPSLWPRAVEEVLRYVSPVLNGMVRTATSDVEVRGTTIRTGDKVTLWYPSANRDEDVFADPFAFDVGRDPNNHVTFGAGTHFCLGASLARLEIRITLGAVFARLRDIELAKPVTRLRSNVSHAIERLPILFAGTSG